MEDDKPTFTICDLVAAQVAPRSLAEQLVPDCRPTATKFQATSAKEELFIRTEIQKLLSASIIDLLKSPLRGKVLVISNERHKKRMVQLPRCLSFTRMDRLIQKIFQLNAFTTLDLTSAYHQIPIEKVERK